MRLCVYVCVCACDVVTNLPHTDCYLVIHIVSEMSLSLLSYVSSANIFYLTKTAMCLFDVYFLVLFRLCTR